MTGKKGIAGITTLDSKQLRTLYYELEDMAKVEQLRLFRLARRAKAHGCSRELVAEIRDEAWSLTSCRVGELLNPFHLYKYAFRD